MLVGLFSQGRFGDAIAHADALTRQYPGAAQLYNIMGAARAAMGETDQALAQYAKSIATDPDYTEAHSNLGATLFQLGRLSEATGAFKAALQINPTHPQATANLGAVLCKLQRFDEARAMLQRALQINPKNPDALGSLGVVLNALGQPDAAAEMHRRAIALRPGQVADYSHLGTALASAGHSAPALDAFRQALEIDANDTDALNNLGNLLTHLGKTTEAQECFEKALAINPVAADIWNNLGAARATLGAHDQALEHFRSALEIAPAFAEAHDNMGLSLYVLGRHEDATKAFERALQCDPGYAPAMANLAMALNDIGQRPEAVKLYEQALSLRPGLVDAFHRLARIKQFAADDPLIVSMLGLVDQPTMKSKDRMHLGFGLGKAMEDIGNAEKAFKHISAANLLRKGMLDYDLRQDENLFTRLEAAFANGEPAADIAPDGQIKPIFIVGMPRSGTSLVEQILASHPQVHGAGELSDLEKAIRQSGWDGTAPHQNMLAQVARSYRSGLGRFDTQAGFVTDKMPLNFRWIGFVIQALSEARIVHVKRDARATCWSIFKHYFAESGSHYGYDLDDLVGFYQLYSRLMAFWTRRYPGRIIQLNYEQLTENQEGETRALLAAVGLPWDDSCLQFHKTQRRVATASAHQVRDAMYSGSSQQWRKYDKFLQGPFARLDGL